MAVLNGTDQQVLDVIRLFFDVEPLAVKTINTSFGENDFREVIIIEAKGNGKYVIKLADNDFTFPEKIEVWKKTVEKYRDLGYFCPKISYDKTGKFPIVSYKGHTCAAYAEEYSVHRSADEFSLSSEAVNRYEKEKWIMTAKIAAEYLDYTEFPSGYCLFDTFSPSDEMDEVLENAQEWWNYARTLPEEF